MLPNTPEDAELLHLLALCRIDGVGPTIARLLLEAFGCAQAVMRQPVGLLTRVPGVRKATAQTIVEAAPLAEAQAELDWCRRQGIGLVTILGETYPHLLRQVQGAPVSYFCWGGAEIDTEKCVAVVGTRTPSPYGRSQAELFARELAEAGYTVVSGLAYGVDQLAHKAALAAGGRTVAVLGSGLGRIYPAKHTGLAREIAQSPGSCVISEYWHNTAPDPHNFPHRNRIIAGLCRAVIVVEANIKGGALITAQLAFDQNREVYAVPGNLGQPTSAGCNLLIRDHVARLITSPQEVIADLDPATGPAAPRLAPIGPHTAMAGSGQKGYKTPQPPKPLPDLQPDQYAILLAIDQGRHQLDQIALETSIPVAELVSHLLALEFAGIVRQAPGRLFFRA